MTECTIYGSGRIIKVSANISVQYVSLPEESCCKLGSLKHLRTLHFKIYILLFNILIIMYNSHHHTIALLSRYPVRPDTISGTSHTSTLPPEIPLLTRLPSSTYLPLEARPQESM
jgi:hypothetical protein